MFFSEEKNQKTFIFGRLSEDPGLGRRIYWVHRCSGWAVMMPCRQRKVEFAYQQIDHGFEVSYGAVAASLCFGSLHQAVDSLDQPVGDAAVEPAQNAVAMALDGARCLEKSDR